MKMNKNRNMQWMKNIPALFSDDGKYVGVRI